MSACPDCGVVNASEARFCSGCGAPLAAAPRPEEERKTVTVLFVDLVGFTARSERADPEDVQAILRTYHGRLKGEIERFGGTVEKFVGDAVMAVFGAPVAHEDDPERAVRAALRILEAIEELNKSEPGLELEVRAAVNTGQAVVTVGSHPAAGEGIVAGDVVNTAARLQQAAPRGGVVVGELTFRATAELIEYEPLEPVALKGKADAVPLWLAKQPRSRVRAERVSTTPFVGRDTDLAALDEAFGLAVAETRIGLVTIVGEPGAGKTRLVGEFRALLDDRPALVWWRRGQCLPYGEGVTFWALGEIIKSQAGILESDGPDSVTEKLELAVGAVVTDPTERDWLTGSLAPLIGAGVRGKSTRERGASFTAWRRFFEAVASNRPLVLVFEDLHWADAALVDFVEHLAEWSSGVAMLVVCTARPELYERHPGWGGARRDSTTITLSPLNDESTTRLIDALLPGAKLPASTREALLQRAGGNPLYAQEFARMLRDRGNGASATADIPVPETVQALISARLDALTPAQKALARDAAVVGEVFWAGALADMEATDELAVEQGLHELTRKELVRPARSSSIVGEAEYAFSHTLVRDVAYGTIPRRRRAERHCAAAGWIERIAGDRVGDHAEILAHHYGEALRLAQAAAYSELAAKLGEPTRRFFIMAGDRALPLDVDRAEAYYRQALELLPPDDPARAQVLVSAADAAQEAGRLHEAVRDYEEAIPKLRLRSESLAAGEAMTSLARALWRLGRTADNRRLLSDAIDLLEREQPGPELARAYTRSAVDHMIGNRSEESLEYSKKAIAMAEALGMNELLVRALQTRGYARGELGDLGGIDDLREALRLGLELGLGFETATAFGNLGDWVRYIEGPAKGLEMHRAGLEFAVRRGLKHHGMWMTVETLRTLFEVGEWDELLELSDRPLEWDRDQGGTPVGAIALTYRANVFARRGAFEQADALAGEFLPRARDAQDPQVLAPALLVGALVEEGKDRPLGALGLVEEFAETTRPRGIDRACGLPDAVRICIRAGAIEQGKALLEGIAETTARHRWAALTGRARLREAEGDLESAVELYREAAAGWTEYGFLFEQGLASLGAGRCLLGLVRADEAGSPLANARLVFERLGAAPLLEETRACEPKTAAP